MKITQERAEQIAKELITATCNRMKQELAGYSEEHLPRLVLQHRARLARYNWKFSQKWCKWDNDGPVLMPDYTRIYYRKGSSEILLQEFPPQVRLMKFKGALVNRPNSTASISQADAASTHHFSLALPYTIFLFKFVNGVFVEVRVAFNDRPLKRLEERPLRPYLSNIATNLRVCLGASFDRAKLIKDNLAQQAAFVLDHFWHTVYSDEWSIHYWATKSHFQSNDSRMSGLQSWEASSQENPLFVVEDVNWLKHSEEAFGDIIVRLLEDDEENAEMHEELYRELTDNFLEEFKKAQEENIQELQDVVSEKLTKELTQRLLTRLAE